MIRFPEGVSLKVLSRGLLPRPEFGLAQGFTRNLSRSLTRPRLAGVALLFVLLLSACGPGIAGESWAGISTDGKYVYVAWKEDMFRVNYSEATIVTLYLSEKLNVLLRPKL